MTREEATEILRKRKRYCEVIAIHANATLKADELREIEAIDIAITALRPVSREQVEKVWRGEWSYSHTTETDRFAVVKCSKCGHEAFGIAFYVTQGNFCPVCGAAQTDEAVEMVMERMETINNA